MRSGLNGVCKPRKAGGDFEQTNAKRFTNKQTRLQGRAHRAHAFRGTIKKPNFTFHSTFVCHSALHNTAHNCPTVPLSHRPIVPPSCTMHQPTYISVLATLRTVNMSADSIQTTSALLQSLYADSDKATAAVEAWFEACRKGTGESLLPLIYVANDVLQVSCKKLGNR